MDCYGWVNHKERRLDRKAAADDCASIGNIAGCLNRAQTGCELYLESQRPLRVSDSEQLRLTRRPGWVGWVVDHFPPGQFGRYLVVGLVNTIFGYGTYAGLTALFTPHIPYAYMLASVIAGLLNVSFAFVNYKFFIFKTKGNALREWSRCIVLYSGSGLVFTVLLAPTVLAIRFLTPADKSAPYVGGGILMAANVIAGFLGHKTFSFAPVADKRMSTPTD